MSLYLKCQNKLRKMLTKPSKQINDKKINSQKER